MKKYRIHLLLYASFFAVWVLLTRGAVSPLIYPDEAGYIGWARTLSGTPGEVWRYLPGYGLLLAPVFAVTDHLETAYQAVILINCLLGAALPVLFYSILGRTGLLEGKSRWLAAVAAGLYPSWLLYGNLALCEVWLAFLYAVLLWAVTGWDKGKKYWIITAMCCVWLVASHGRGMAAVLGTAAALCAYFWHTPWKKKVLSCCGVLAAAGVICGIFYLAGTDSVNGAHLREQVIGLFTVRGLWNTLSTWLSQGYYLVLSTFGVAVLGVWYGVQRLRKTGAPFLWFIMTVFLCTMALSAVFMNHHEKPDHILYGRYNEFALGGILLLGMTAFFKKRCWGNVLIVFAGLALFTYVRYGQDLSGIDANLCHTWGLYWYKILFNRFTFWGVAAWFALAGGMMYGIRRYRPGPAAVFLCCLFLAVVCFTKYDYFIKGAAPRYQPSQLQELLEGEEQIAARSLTGNTMGYSWGVYHLLTENPELSLSDEAELLLSPQRIEGGALLGSESYDTLYLYAADPAQAEEYRQKQMVVGQAFSGTVALQEVTGQSLTVSLTNTGSPWLCYSGTEDLADCVRVAVWIDQEGEETKELRLDLPKHLYRGQQATLEIPLELEDGDYRIQVSPVVDLSQIIASAVFDAKIRDGAILEYEETEPEPKTFTKLVPENYLRQTTGLYRGYSTGKTVLDKLHWSAGQPYLVLYTKGQTGQMTLSVNGRQLPCVKRGGNAFTFSLEGISVIDRIEIDCETRVPAKTAGLPKWLSWLRADSPCKPVSFFVRGIDKLFGLGWDFCSYGIRIDRIMLEEEL